MSAIFMDFQNYLLSISSYFSRWWELYTVTDVLAVGEDEKKPKPLLDFNLQVQSIRSDPTFARSIVKGEKRWGVLEALRRYASENVLLVGHPGSGKSTAIARLILEEVETFSQHKRIPVLVELRYYQTSVIDLILAFLRRHDPRLDIDITTIEGLLSQSKLFLLFDGLNELFLKDGYRELYIFRQNHEKTTPMVFTTRDLGIGGDLGIGRKFELQALTTEQTQQFVYSYLPEQGEQLLQHLNGRLRELGQTPMFLWMLCSVFEATGEVPITLGLVFRWFTQVYEKRIKQDVIPSLDLKHWCPLLLQHLAFTMSQGKASGELRVSIPKAEAVEILKDFLQDRVAHPDDCALRWLEDLKNHHLIRLEVGDKIEFQHQMIQEYYSAEYLERRIKFISNDSIQKKYLNYFKWTEILVLMMELLEDSEQVLRLLKLSLEVDLRLTAKLAGAVRPEFEKQAVELLIKSDIHINAKTQILGVAKSNYATPFLSKTLVEGFEGCSSSTKKEERTISRNSFCVTRNNSAESLYQIGTEESFRPLRMVASKFALHHLLSEGFLAESKVFGREDPLGRHIRTDPEETKRERNSKIAEESFKLFSQGNFSELMDAVFDTRFIAEEIMLKLHRKGSEITIPHLLEVLKEDRDNRVYGNALLALAEISGESAAPELCRILSDQNCPFRRDIIKTLGKIRDRSSVSILCKVLQENIDCFTTQDAAEALGEIGSEAAVPTLIEALSANDWGIWNSATIALGKCSVSGNLPTLMKIFKTSPTSSRMMYAISAIQEKCGFYNYEIQKSSSSQDFIESDPLVEIRDLLIQSLKAMSESPKTQFNFYAPVSGVASNVEGDLIVNSPAKSPAEAAAEIQELLQKLSESSPDMTEVELVKQAIQHNPTLKARLLAALKSGGTEALKVLLPFSSIPIEMLRGWIEAE